MRLELEEEEIKSAIIAYIAAQGLTVNTEKTQVDLKNARGDFGVTATISIKQGIASVKVQTADTKVTVADEPADSKKLKFGSN